MDGFSNLPSWLSKQVKTLCFSVIKDRYDSLHLLTPTPSHQPINQHFAVGPRTSPTNCPPRLVSVRRQSAALPVLLVGLLEHFLALQLRLQPGADEERAAHLAMQRVGLLWGRGEPVFEHHWDQVMDPLRGGLRSEVEGLCGRKGLAEDHHRIHVSIHHRLETR